MRLTTLKYRIKDSNTKRQLDKMSGTVNFVWNYCNDVNYDSWRKFRRTYSAFDLNKMTSGCAKDLGLHSQTIQAVCEEYDKSRKQHKKVKLSWRSKKRSLGWIPFKGSGVKINNDVITYNKNKFKIWLSRPIEGVVRFGSFNQDSKGRWYINLVVEDSDVIRFKTGKEVGVDLGLKTIATLSDGTEINRESVTKKYEKKLAIAQRAKKKRQVSSIHAKIKNTRNDWNHKQTTNLIRDYDKIVVGNVSSSKLKKTRMAKSVSDATWSSLKAMLVYKAIRFGVEVIEVNESFSTMTCSECGDRTGPRGLSGLKVREWICSNCGKLHNRDVNAATNILLSVQDIERRRESPTLK